ncbi:MAG: hypothetical protein M3128_09395 [Verrucomicrobiota bacterium]|nr:hypothetical protein [Verrucomicrobiota bacterium]
MFYAALFFIIFLVIGSVYFLSSRKQDRAPGLRHAMAIIALLIIVALLWIYRSRYGN